MKAIHIKRLEDVVKVLREEVPRGQFDIRTWFDKGDCGTMACAAGWYAHRRPRSGLKLSRAEDLRTSVPFVRSRGGYERGGVVALEFHFGLKYHDIEELFLPDGYSTPDFRRPKAVAKKIAAFIRKQKTAKR